MGNENEQFLDGESKSHQHSGTKRNIARIHDDFKKRLKDDEKEIGEKRPILESPLPSEIKKEEVTKKVRKQNK